MIRSKILKLLRIGNQILTEVYSESTICQPDLRRKHSDFMRCWFCIYKLLLFLYFSHFIKCMEPPQKSMRKSQESVDHLTSLYSSALAVGEMMLTPHQGCSFPMRLPVFRRPSSFDSLTRCQAFDTLNSIYFLMHEVFSASLWTPYNWSGISMSR